MRYRSYQNQFILAAELDFVEPVSFKRKTTKWPFLGLTRQNLTTSRYEFSVAILSTKIPILLGHGFWHFTLPKLSGYGFLSMMHEARTDFSMWLGLLFLLIIGAGACSADARCSRRNEG